MAFGFKRSDFEPPLYFVCFLPLRPYFSRDFLTWSWVRPCSGLAPKWSQHSCQLFIYPSSILKRKFFPRERSFPLLPVLTTVHQRSDIRSRDFTCPLKTRKSDLKFINRDFENENFDKLLSTYSGDLNNEHLNNGNIWITNFYLSGIQMVFWIPDKI